MPIVGDISEKRYVHDAMKKKEGDNYSTEELGIYECMNSKCPMLLEDEMQCVEEHEISCYLDYGYTVNASRDWCKKCDAAEYVRFADFFITNEKGEVRAAIERKAAPDFLSSRRDRLYKQLDKLDKYVSARKILLLEGTKRDLFTDSKNFFSNNDKRRHDLRGLSPLEQCIEIGGSPEWTESFMNECFSRDIWFLQSADLNETIKLLHYMDKGFDQIPKVRLIPKKIPSFSTAQIILATIKGIGKVTSANLLTKHSTIEAVITHVKKMKASDRKGVYKNIYDALCKKPNKVIK